MRPRGLSGARGAPSERGGAVGVPASVARGKLGRAEEERLAADAAASRCRGERPVPRCRGRRYRRGSDRRGRAGGEREPHRRRKEAASGAPRGGPRARARRREVPRPPERDARVGDAVQRLPVQHAPHVLHRRGRCTLRQLRGDHLPLPAHRRRRRRGLRVLPVRATPPHQSGRRDQDRRQSQHPLLLGQRLPVACVLHRHHRRRRRVRPRDAHGHHAHRVPPDLPVRLPRVLRAADAGVHCDGVPRRGDDPRLRHRLPLRLLLRPAAAADHARARLRVARVRRRL
mmetsp:Transcript_17636/g.54697  ORF Transcript_17636/g.54697 Transcript_17636/m.54697 type:complete len:286 (+) Transcript_17636:316-1173(+)